MTVPTERDIRDALFVEGSTVSYEDVTLAHLQEEGAFGRASAELLFAGGPSSVSAASADKVLDKIARIYARTLRDAALKAALGLQ